MRVVIICAILAFSLDQLSKWWVVHVLDLKNRIAIDVLPPLLNFRMGWNTGINFGLLSDSPEIMRWILIALAVGVSIWLLIWGSQMQNFWAKFAAGHLIGGALANALDRVLYGAVADFLNMSCCGIQNPFTFNVADIFIFAGAIGLVVFADREKGA